MQNAVPFTIVQLTYRSPYSAILTWITWASSLAVAIRYHLVAAFVAGLLWLRATATCTAIEWGGVASHDALNRLLNVRGRAVETCSEAPNGCHPEATTKW